MASVILAPCDCNRYIAAYASMTLAIRIRIVAGSAARDVGSDRGNEKFTMMSSYGAEYARLDAIDGSVSCFVHTNVGVCCALHWSRVRCVGVGAELTCVEFNGK